MDKKSVIGLIIILIAAGVMIWLFLMRPEQETPFVPTIPEEEEIEEKLKMGLGYSTKKEEKEAVLDAVNEMKAQLGEAPVFAILTSTVGYSQEEVLAEVNRLLPGVKIYGYTSLLGIMTNDGFQIGEGADEGQTLSLMGFSSDDIVFGVGACDLDKAASSQEAGRTAVTRAIANAGKTTEDVPKVVLISTSPFGIGEGLVVEGVEDVLGEHVPLVGGGAAAGYSDLVSGGEALFANDKVYRRGVVVAPIYTELKIGHAFLSGFNPTGDKGTVTKFEMVEGESRIIEIDNMPAARTYNDWLDGAFEKYLGTSEMFLGESVFHTLGEKVTETGGFVNWKMIVPFHFNPDDSVTVGAPAPEGTELYLLESNQELFIQRAALAVRLARSRGGITEKEIAGVVLDQCGGSLLGIPVGISGWNEMITFVNQAAVDTPFLGVSNLGPYGYFAGVGNRYGEVTASVLVFGKQE
jgi:hypothetical protein